MNYYATGGAPYGLNTLANSDFYSRGVQYKGGIPAYGIGGALKSVWKGTVGRIEDAIKPITEPITDAIKPILPYAQFIAPFIPGVNAAWAAGLGALGSGFAGGGGFNFKRGLMGGMTAYGLSNLYSGLQGAGGGTPGGTTSTSVAPVDANAANVADLAVAEGSPTAGMTASTTSEAIADRVAAMPTDFSNQMSNAGQGIKNLAGMGDVSAADAAKAFSGSGATMTNTVAPAFMGYTGSAAIDEAEKMQEEADLANAKSQGEYNDLMAKIEASKERGITAMKSNPYMFAAGGPVPQMAPGGLSSLQGQRDGYETRLTPSGDIPQMANGGSIGGYSDGGRMLKGPGDGMSDSIPATIGDKQPARLADGEFVVPADVVSHLGNGSTGAGAKQLYKMMDNVRAARTGTKKQGKQINPNKFVPA